jgi:3'-5' exoribonuclease
MEHIFIKDLTPDFKGESFYLLRMLGLRDKKNGGNYLIMKFADSTGDIVAMMWDNFEGVTDSVKPGDFVKIRFRTQVYNNKMQLIVTKIRKAEDSEIDNPSLFFPASEIPANVMLDELNDLIEKEFESGYLKTLVSHIYNDEELQKKMLNAPAAKNMHHAFRGGYLEHVLTLFKLALQVLPVYPYIHKELVLAGILLHDIGKLWELSYETDFNYTTEGRLLGHIILEYDFVKLKILEIPEFPKELELHLLHIILAHHGELEYGSPKRPKTPEALLVSNLDNLDAKMKAMKTAIDADVPSDNPDWTPYLPMFERMVYKKRP